MSKVAGRDHRSAQNAVRLKRTKKALMQVANGQLVDGNAVLKWLGSWGTNQETRAPNRRH